MGWVSSRIMDCRTFRQLHGLWIDGGLAPRHAERLLSHVGECEGCAHFDAMVRRALLVARNSSPVSCSADFAERLRIRLAEERACRGGALATDDALVPGAVRPRLAPAWRVAAAAALVIGGTAVTLQARQAAGVDGAAPHGFDSAGLGAPIATWSALGAASSPAVMPVAAPRSDFVVVRRAAFAGQLVPVVAGDSLRDAEAAAVTPAAPLWPSAAIAGRAARRFVATEFAPTPVAATLPH